MPDNPFREISRFFDLLKKQKTFQLLKVISLNLLGIPEFAYTDLKFLDLVFNVKALQF